MKKLVLTALLFLSTTAMAAQSGILTISGSVTSINDIVVNPTANATQIDIINGSSNLLVATVEETSNNLTGYKISMRSANASNLVHSTDSTKSTSYTISYDGAAALSLSNSDQVVKNVSSLAGLTTDTSDVVVNSNAYATAPAGTYSDTITISIAAN